MERIKVWDLPVRLFHAALPLLIVGLFLTSEDEDFVSWHARLGLVVLALVVARIAWGFFGSRHARFSDFVPSPAGLVRYARGYLCGEPEPHLGHNPIGALMVVAMLGVLLLITLTGVVTYAGPEWPRVEERTSAGGRQARLFRRAHRMLRRARRETHLECAAGNAAALKIFIAAAAAERASLRPPRASPDPGE